MRLIMAFATMGMMLTACNITEVKYKKVSSGNDYTLMVPEFTSSMANLHEDASLQYANPAKEFYIIVINESKEKLQNVITDNVLMEEYFPEKTVTAGSYFNFMRRSMVEKGNNVRFSDSSNIKVGTFDAKVATVSGMLNKYKIFYRIASIEGKKDVYQVYVWTLEKNKGRFQPVMDSVIRSLREAS